MAAESVSEAWELKTGRPACFLTAGSQHRMQQDKGDKVGQWIYNMFHVEMIQNWNLKTESFGFQGGEAGGYLNF